MYCQNNICGHIVWGTTRTPSATRVTQLPTTLDTFCAYLPNISSKTARVTLPRVVIYGQATQFAAIAYDCRFHTALQVVRFNPRPGCEVQFLFYWFSDQMTNKCICREQNRCMIQFCVMFNDNVFFSEASFPYHSTRSVGFPLDVFSTACLT